VALVRDYMVAMARAGLQPATRSRRLAALRALWHYLEETGTADSNPCRRVRLPRRPRPTPESLTMEECLLLLDAAENSRFALVAFRDRAIISLLLFTGLRRAELVGLALHDADLQVGTLRVVHGKGGRSRVVPLCEAARAALKDWLEMRPEVEHPSLFTSRTGRPLTARELHRVFRRTVSRAGLTRPGVTLHKLRRTFATMLLRGGVNVAVLQKLLGHASLETTAVYLDVTAEDLAEAVTRHPMATRA